MKIKVFFNNSCNICKMEIDHYKKHSDNNLEWVDITNNQEAINLNFKIISRIIKKITCNRKWRSYRWGKSICDYLV